MQIALRFKSIKFELFLVPCSGIILMSYFKDIRLRVFRATDCPGLEHKNLYEELRVPLSKNKCPKRPEMIVLTKNFLSIEAIKSYIQSDTRRFT